MGLAISKAIVEAHGGRIGVTSQLGTWLRFLLQFAGRITDCRGKAIDFKSTSLPKENCHPERSEGPLSSLLKKAIPSFA